MNSEMLDEAVVAQLKQWPWREAKAIQKSLRNRKPKSGRVLLQTGYGPSGLPHIGTFAEVARTTWVRYAYEALTGEPTTLVAFSDNMDGMRKVPDNVPNKALLQEHLNKPLCRVPDPFGTHESFSGHNNAKLQEFLNHYGFEYEFRAASDMYMSGTFNEGLQIILERYEVIRDIILPTLSEEKRASWSPFFPICGECGRVNGHTILATFPERGALAFRCGHCGREAENPVTDGHAKVGWKVDWALRWFTFGVNYEMYGKDLIDSYELSSKICRAMGGTPPVGMFYEMFLDDEGRKISKSIGNGITIDQWLTYGTVESLALFMFKRPIEASKLYLGAVPQHIDEYLQHARGFAALSGAARLNAPSWFIEHRRAEAGEALGLKADLTFGMLLNLVAVLNTEDPALVWDYLLRSRPDADQEREVISGLVGYAIAYYRDQLATKRVFVAPDAAHRPAVDAFITWLDANPEADAEAIQNAGYEAGKAAGVNLRDFFKAMYQLLIGQEQGPRLGTFVRLYGVEPTAALARQKLRELEAS